MTTTGGLTIDIGEIMAYYQGASHSNGGIRVYRHGIASFAKSNILRTMRPISQTAGCEKQRFASWAQCV
jgi:hypothetical protein